MFFIETLSFFLFQIALAFVVVVSLQQFCEYKLYVVQLSAIIRFKMISTFTNREEKRNFMKIFLFLSNEYQLSSPSLLLAIYGINYCQTNLYVCLLESTPLFHFSSFFMCFRGFIFMPTFMLCIDGSYHHYIRNAIQMQRYMLFIHFEER